MIRVAMKYWSLVLCLVLAGTKPTTGQESFLLCAFTALEWQSEHPSDSLTLPVWDCGAVETPPENVSTPRLRYPRDVREAGYEGTALISAVVETDGQTSHVEVVHVEAWRSVPLRDNRAGGGRGMTPNRAKRRFSEEAIRLIERSSYNPAMVDGKPVRVLICIPVVFNFAQ